MTVEEYFGDWSRVIDIHEADRIMRTLTASKVSTCPKPSAIFKAFKMCDLSDLRVVILGQDPYPQLRKDGNPVATGLAFANSPDTTKDGYSPSLEILMDSLIDFSLPRKTVTFDPSLEKVARQGVLWLNSALSCQAGKPGSHSLLWRPFTKALLSNLSKHKTGIVYVIMGTEAQSFEPWINVKTNHVIRCRHPAFHARTQTPMPPNVWYQVNKILTGQNGYGIQWYEEV